MRFNFLRLSSLVTFLLLTTTLFIEATAADVYAEQYAIVLNGEIRAGDAERIAILAAKHRSLVRLEVNTPGGDVGEAIRIADLVKGLHIDVQVAKGGYCVSACFFVFWEGQRRIATPVQEDGSLQPAQWRANKFGPVGIHRPYLRATAGDVGSIQQQEDVMRKARSYLAAKSVPQHLIDEMMARPSNDIYWLRDRDLELIGEYAPGVEEALVAKCGYKRFRQTDAEQWSREKYDAMYKCTSEHWGDIYAPLHVSYIRRLRTGWRPWNAR